MYKPDINYVNNIIKQLSFSRVASSDDEKKAFNFIENEIKKYNLDFTYQSFQADWRETYDSYIVYDDVKHDVESTMVYNFMGLDWGFADNYDTFINDILSNDRAKKAVRYYKSIDHETISNDENAVAFILNTYDNNLQIACKQLSNNKYVPCVYLPYNENIGFVENEIVTICIKTHTVLRTFQNLIIKSHNKNESPIIIGAHIDTFPGSPGASDDTYGVAIGLDIIRQCVNENIWVVLFTGEEMGCLGSLDFVERNVQTGNVKPRIYMNIDSGIEKGSSNIEITITPESLRERMLHLFKEKYKVGSNVFSSNDSRPFYDAGIPVFWSWASSPHRSHSIYDTLDNVDQTQLKEMMENYALAINHFIR